MFLECFVRYYDKMVVGDLHHTGGNYICFWSQMKKRNRFLARDRFQGYISQDIRAIPRSIFDCI